MKPEKSLRDTMLLLIGLIMVGLVTTAIIATFRAQSPGIVPITMTSNFTASAVLPSTEVPSPYPGPMDYLTPTEAARQTAQAPLDTQYAIILETERSITSSPTVPVTPPATGTRDGDEYIRASGQMAGIDAQNAWTGILNGIKVDMYAGALLDQPEQGAIFLLIRFHLPEKGVVEQILTPTKHGGLRVISELNNRLTLVSTDGTTYYFDVPARRFVDSLTEVMPTATPLASVTPFPPPPTLSSSTPIPTPNPYPAPTDQSTPAP